MKFSLRFLAALGLCTAIATGMAMGDDQANRKPGVWDIHRQNNTQTTPAAQQPQAGVLDHGRVHTSRPVVHGTMPSKRPAGWDKGRKTGWGDCNVPPGQAKKAGCTPAHHDKRWVQRRDHRWQERRADHRRAERRHERIEMARRGHH
jgi:hypothetical protein